MVIETTEVRHRIGPVISTGNSEREFRVGAENVPPFLEPYSDGIFLWISEENWDELGLQRIGKDCYYTVERKVCTECKNIGLFYDSESEEHYCPACYDH